VRGIHSQLDEAMWAVVHEFPRRARRKAGAVGLAPLVGMRPGTLSNKVNPDLDSHHLTVHEAVAIQNAAQDCRILQAEAAILHHAVIPLGDFSCVSDVALLDAYAALHARIGEHAQAIRDTLQDGRVERTEVERVRREFFEVVQAGFAFIMRLEGLIDDESA